MGTGVAGLCGRRVSSSHLFTTSDISDVLGAIVCCWATSRMKRASFSSPSPASLMRLSSASIYFLPF